MNPWEITIAVAAAALVLFTVIFNVCRRFGKKGGSCCSGGCDGNCSACRHCANLKDNK